MLLRPPPANSASLPYGSHGRYHLPLSLPQRMLTGTSSMYVHADAMHQAHPITYICHPLEPPRFWSRIPCRAQGGIRAIERRTLFPPVPSQTCPLANHAVKRHWLRNGIPSSRAPSPMTANSDIRHTPESLHISHLIRKTMLYGFPIPRVFNDLSFGPRDSREPA